MHPFELQLETDWPRAAWRDLTVLVAVSAGADSVALLRGLVALAHRETPPCAPETAGCATSAAGAPAKGPGQKDASSDPKAQVGRIIVAHFHHGLRGAEADADAQFVVDLCKQLAVECVVGRAKESDSLGQEPINSLSDLKPPSSLRPTASEETSRDARYQFLMKIARQVGARYVAVAHTADDQAETVLHHILRGTGLAGLGGMPRARELADGVALVRPLLAARRAAARAYLADLGQSFREDSSNADSAYTRNRLRNELLPALAANYNPQIIEALLRLGALAADAQSLLSAQGAALAGRSVTRREPGRLTLDAAALAAAPRGLVCESLRALWREEAWPLAAMGHNEWNDLATMAMDPAPRKRVFPGEVIVERTADELTLRRAP